MSKLILGFIGPIASGKGTACRYFSEKYQADSFRFSSILRDILDRLYLPQSRENMQELSLLLRENFSQDILSKAIAEDANKAAGELVVIDGIRRESDIKHLRHTPGFKLIGLAVDVRRRYERLVQRHENSDDQNKTWEEFQKDQEAEAERQIPEMIRKADVVIDNNGTLEEFYKNLDRLVE
ncbi:MAG: hypothetical protein COY66_01960 [Candidatus Kerfeldbacteria bacterium CG_4_10_14_0_8_um_filter_42_10]|uniref:Dephospho-CoA kinase n=1 Tax=Candidatus Kerfeldbacteria bacterium CG_4_10_14_0_8_um_filter_42_10 TaxID=2014248 RepID=A0A2M7RJM8_9BACT|nr:MAG: hypothetical protein COY66_01960 [Candidatus Kerfeldbacteria bacterium CG_4_10_14_0_8_um_filter_42_10]